MVQGIAGSRGIMDITVGYSGIGECVVTCDESTTIAALTDAAVKNLVLLGLREGDWFELMQPGASVTLVPDTIMSDYWFADGDKLELLATGYAV